MRFFFSDSFRLRKPFSIPLANVLVDRSLGERSISLSRSDRCVTEEVLNCHDRHSGFQHMGRGRMPHCMRRVAFFPEEGWVMRFAECHVLLEDDPNTGNGHMLVRLAAKNVTV